MVSRQTHVHQLALRFVSFLWFVWPLVLSTEPSACSQSMAYSTRDPFLPPYEYEVFVLTCQNPGNRRDFGRLLHRSEPKTGCGCSFWFAWSSRIFHSSCTLGLQECPCAQVLETAGHWRALTTSRSQASRVYHANRSIVQRQVLGQLQVFSLPQIPSSFWDMSSCFHSEDQCWPFRSTCLSSGDADNAACLSQYSGTSTLTVSPP